MSVCTHIHLYTVYTYVLSLVEIMWSRIRGYDSSLVKEEGKLNMRKC